VPATLLELAVLGVGVLLALPLLLLLPAVGALLVPAVVSELLLLLLELLLLMLEGGVESAHHSTQQADNGLEGALISNAAGSHNCKIACIVSAAVQ
jgi:hypothetical protein